MDEELITLVVHTPDHAAKLKEILEFHGISVTLEDVDADGLAICPAPKKIRIPLSSLPLGLKILESGEAAVKPFELLKMTGMSNSLLIPVDLSPHSMLAVKVGFFIATKFDVEPIVLHSFIGQMFAQSEMQFEATPDEDPDLGDEAIEAASLHKIASARLLKFRKKIQAAQLAGELPDIKFSTTLLEGVPEQVIQEYCKQNNPLLVVMATRGANKKGEDLVGSVTAEVIDSCRVPVVTVPDNYVPSGLEAIKNVTFFCSFTGFDSLFMRWLMRSFDFPAMNFTLLPATDSSFFANTRDKLDRLRDFFAKAYPTAEFHTEHLQGSKFDDMVRKSLEENNTQLILVPNKKSSAISRFFRPTLAHKILFEKDIPLLVLPV